MDALARAMEPLHFGAANVWPRYDIFEVCFYKYEADYLLDTHLSRAGAKARRRRGALRDGQFALSGGGLSYYGGAFVMFTCMWLKTARGQTHTRWGGGL